MKPIDLTRELEHRGFNDGSVAKTPLPTRVANELWRLTNRRKVLTKTRSGLYRMINTDEKES